MADTSFSRRRHPHARAHSHKAQKFLRAKNVSSVVRAPSHTLSVPLFNADLRSRERVCARERESVFAKKTCVRPLFDFWPCKNIVVMQPSLSTTETASLVVEISLSSESGILSARGVVVTHFETATSTSTSMSVHVASVATTSSTADACNTKKNFICTCTSSGGGAFVEKEE